MRLEGDSWFVFVLEELSIITLFILIGIQTPAIVRDVFLRGKGLPL